MSIEKSTLSATIIGLIVGSLLGVAAAVVLVPRLEQHFLEDRIVTELAGAPPTMPFHLHTPASFHSLIAEGAPWVKNRLHEETAGAALARLRETIPMIAPPIFGERTQAEHEEFIRVSGLDAVFKQVGLSIDEMMTRGEEPNLLVGTEGSVAYRGAIAPAGFALPAEHAPLSGVLLSWPINYPTRWSHHAEFAKRIGEAGAKAVILAPSRAWCLMINAYLKASGADTAQVFFLRANTDDVWIRDFGPHIVKSAEGGVAIVASPYAPSGKNFEKWNNEAPLAVAGALNLECYRLPLIVEGGNLVSDGAGTMVMFDSVLHNNPELSKAEVERAIKAWFGATRVLMFPSLEGEITGHIDMVVKFHDAETVLVADAAPGFKWKRNFDHVAETLGRKPSGTGVPYRVIRVPIVPRPAEAVEFWSYINSLTVNDTIILPFFDPEYDRKAVEIYESLGTHRIVGIDFRDFPLGSVHCQSKEIPAGLLVQQVGQQLASDERDSVEGDVND
jgi:agmatine deiminase